MKVSLPVRRSRLELSWTYGSFIPRAETSAMTMSLVEIKPTTLKREPNQRAREKTIRRETTYIRSNVVDIVICHILNPSWSLKLEFHCWRVVGGRLDRIAMRMEIHILFWRTKLVQRARDARWKDKEDKEGV